MLRRIALLATLTLLAAAPSLATADPPAAAEATVAQPDGRAPRWSFGLSLPISRFGWTRAADGSYGGAVTPLQAGVGAAVFYNAIRGDHGSVPVGVGALLFGATNLSNDLGDTGLGVAVGPSFWNNTFSVMVGVDLYRRIGAADTGVLMLGAGGNSGFDRQNVFLLFNFGVGLGDRAPGSIKIAP